MHSYYQNILGWMPKPAVDSALSEIQSRKNRYEKQKVCGKYLLDVESRYDRCRNNGSTSVQTNCGYLHQGR